MADADRLIRLLKEAGLEGDETAERLVKLAQASPSGFTEESVERALELYAADHVSRPFQGAEFDVDSGIVLGVSCTGSVYTVSEDELSNHVSIVGRSGAGKTTFLYNLLDQVDVPWWSFDLKQDFRHLAKDMDVVVFPAEELRLNPLEPPPGVKLNDWVQTFAEIFADSQALLDASENFTKRSVRSFTADLEEYVHGQTELPSLYQVLLALEDEGINFVRKRANYRDVVANRMRGVYDDLPATFAAQNSVDLPGLVKRNMVLELGSVSSGTQNFVMEILLAWLYEYRKAQDHRGEGIRHLTVADEGKKMFSRYKEESVDMGLPTIDETLAQLREFQEGVVVADQESQKLTESLKSNTYLKVLMSTANAKELEETADTLGLDTFQRSQADLLGVGEAVVRKADQRPARLQVPDYDLEKDVSDTEVEEMMQSEWERYRERCRVDGAPPRRTKMFTESEGDGSGERGLDEF